MPGVADLSLEANVGKPQIRIQVDRAQLARYGLNADDVLNVVRTGIGNEPVSTLIDGVRRFDITARIGDASKASVEAIRDIPLHAASGAIVPLTIFFIFVLLYTAFDSVKYAALILAHVPFATIGGLVTLFISGQYLSVPSVIGFIAVFGVAMLNGIVLVSFINELRENGLRVNEAVRRGSELSLRPVLRTAGVAILGLIPMLLSTGVGAEIQRPLASVVVGELITYTLLTLILLPVIYE